MKRIFLRKELLHKPFLFLLLLFFFFNSDGQIFPKKNYPKGYFIYPVEAKIGLAANFGELRPNHYHMGLDCRTNHLQNRPVKAAADGYVAHVRVEPFGFGRAIYINHPNGLTTLYGHLNNFYPALEKYVKEQQYKLKSWQVFLDIPPGMFPVKQGQFIAFSGNAGGSQGPHCHFEIRDTKTDKVLNPLLFGMPIPDNVPPTIVRLAMYDRSISTYSQSPKLFSLKKIKGGYTTIEPVITVNTDKVSFGISANDKFTGSTNPNGIYEAVLYLDETPVVGFEIDSITYDESRYVNAHIDYKKREEGGPFIEHLSRLPGYPEGIYKDVSGDGVIELTDDAVHEIKIVVKDTYGNTSTLGFKIKKGLIREKQLKSEAVSYQDQQEFHPGFVNIYENENVQLILKPEALYDSFAFRHSSEKAISPTSYSDIHFLESGLVPVHDNFTLRLKADKPVPPQLADRMLIKRTWHGKTEVVKATRDGEWFTAHFRSFGNFELIADDEPPVIVGGVYDNANLSKASRIIFIPKDNNEEIKNFRAELDGHWLMFTNDKGRLFIYKFDEMCTRGKHELKVSVQDEADNTTEKIYHFTR
ncbi:MAG TPA: M23 family metallopeptidase [Ginsengibacter sp.]|nr:M23 family metallopeptidase [Ginsengibacter sp.]